MDSNHRSLRRQIYSLIHLAALESVRIWCSASCGAGDWTWTHNLLITNQLLCQLSYTGMWCLEVESNHRQRDFQSLALPTELSRHWFFGLSAEKRVKKWRPKRGSNSWPPAWQAGALTKLSYWAVLFKYIKLLVGLHGFEPRTNRLWADSSDHWAKGPSAAFKTYGLSHKCLYMINYFSGKVKYFSIEKQKFFFGKIRPDFPKKSKIRRELSCKM